MKFSVSKLRRRTYERSFDWELARTMHRAGFSFAEIARRLNVDRRGVARVCKLPESRVRRATDEQILGAGPRDRVPCPRCARPMVPSASLCRDCTNETRLLPMTVRRVLGTDTKRPRSRVELRAVEMQRIVEVDGDWGVVVPYPKGGRCPRGYRVVDFWEDGPALVSDRIRVHVAPSTEVLVGGIAQETEEIPE